MIYILHIKAQINLRLGPRLTLHPARYRGVSQLQEVSRGTVGRERPPPDIVDDLTNVGAVQSCTSTRNEELWSEGLVMGCLEDLDRLSVDRGRDEDDRAFDDVGQDPAL